jgi:hypothetical protein
VDWAFDNGHVGNADQQHFVHVLKNTGMTVARYTDTGDAAGDNNITITAVADLSNTVCVGSAYSSGTGFTYSRGWKGIYLTSTTNVNAWASISGNGVSVRVQVAELPGIVGWANEMTISGSTATFATALADNIGVGDAIQYDSDDDDIIDAIAFIHGRTSSTEYTVKDKDGNAPTAVTADTDWAIYRAYTSLYNWQAQDENNNLNDTVENFDTSKVLTDILNVACYADGADTTASEVNISGWTTGASSYIRIYTPTLASEVGTSQRHNGAAGTGFVLKPSTSSPGEYFSGIDIREDYVRIEGIEIDGSTITNGEALSGIQTADMPHSRLYLDDRHQLHLCGGNKDRRRVDTHNQ